MKYEELLAAKIRLIELNANIGLCCGLVAVIMAVALLTLGYFLSNSKSYRGDSAFWLSFMGIICAAVATLAIPISIYDKTTAEIQARADMANYHLIEVSK